MDRKNGTICKRGATWDRHSNKTVTATVTEYLIEHKSKVTAVTVVTVKKSV
jgi:hypothetical protein